MTGRHSQAVHVAWPAIGVRVDGTCQGCQSDTELRRTVLSTRNGGLNQQQAYINADSEKAGDPHSVPLPQYYYVHMCSVSCSAG